MKRFVACTLLCIFLAGLMAPAMATTAEDSDLPALKDVYKDDFLIGNIFSPSNGKEDLDFAVTHFNVMTAENAMKPDQMQPSKGNFKFDSMDKAIAYFLERDIAIHGHTLAWHNQSPKFLNTNVTYEEALQNMTDHVNTVAGHYAGQILSWDVLNEAMNDGISIAVDWRSNLRRSDWYNAFAGDGRDGADYVYTLFKLAREADPETILYYNDYNLDNPGKASAVYYMVKELNEAYLAEGNDRLLIEGVGMQGHYNVNTKIDGVRQSIELFKELGVEISITELDVTVNGAAATGLTEEEEARQALVYAQLFALFREHSDVIARVTFWGLTDRLSWRGDRYPQIFDGMRQPKEAFYAVADPEGYLALHAPAEPQGPLFQEGEVPFATPVIDGEIDDVWADAQPLSVGVMLQAWQTASGTARVLWDNQNLYVLTEVRDNTPDQSSPNHYEQDSVEVFLDQRNDKTEVFGADDGQYRVSAAGRQSFGENTDSTGFDSAVSTGDNTYIVEMKIPLGQMPFKSRASIGFDVQINDGQNGSRVGVAKWNDISDNSYLNTTGWGVLTLVGGDENTDVDNGDTNDTDDATDAPTTATPSPTADGLTDGNDDAPTSLFMIIPIVLVVVAALVVVLLFLRKRGKK